MQRFLALIIVLVASGLGACGGTVDLACDDVELYQLAEKRPRIQAPEDLDALDPIREVPLPEASPRPQRPPGSPCLDRPPTVTISN